MPQSQHDHWLTEAVNSVNAPCRHTLPDIKHKRPRLVRLLWLLLFLNSPSLAQDTDCHTRISGFDFVGNEITLANNLQRWSGLKPGDLVSIQQLQQARQKIMDTRLYKQVDVHADNICAEHSRITIRIEEKRYHLVYPRVSRNGDGDITKGLVYQGRNLFGSDHSIKLEASQKDFVNGDNADRYKFEYDQPLAFKPYLLRWQAHSFDTVLADTQEQAIKIEENFSFLVGRDWHTETLKQPISVYIKIGLKTKSLDDPLNESDIEPGGYHSLGLLFEYDDIHQEKYRRYGKFLSTEISRGMEVIGTDFDTTELHLVARFYHRLNSLDNFNSQFKLSLASSKTFGENNFTLGGAESLRGLETDFAEGNSLWQANLEYVKGFQDWRNFRVSVFTDFGNVFRDYNTFNGEDWFITVGAGLRWKIQSFVDTDLVIDYGADTDSGFTKVYASTSVIF